LKFFDNTKNLSLFYIVLYTIILFIVLGTFKDIFTVIVATVFNVILLKPIVFFFKKNFKLSSRVSKILALSIFFFGFIIILVFLIPAVAKELGNFIKLITDVFNEKLWRDYLKESPNLQELVDKFMDFVQPKLLEFADYLFNMFISRFPEVVMVIFFAVLGTIYVTFYIDTVGNAFEKMFPKKCRSEIRVFIKDLYDNMERFVLAVFITALITGLSFWTVFKIFGLDYSAVVGAWAFITNFIPIVGVFLEYIPVFLFSLSLGIKGIVWIALFTVIIHSIAFILFIHLMKGYAKLNPIYIIFSILLFGKVFGFLGIFIAVPLAIYIQIMWKRFVGPIFERVV